MQHVDFDNYSFDYEAIFQDDFTDSDSSSDTEEILNSDSDEENKLLYLTKMGYSEAEGSIAMERCGLDSSITELTDFICVAQMAKAADALLLVEDRKPLCNDPNYKKMQNSGYDFFEKEEAEKKLLNEDDHAVHLLNLMIGFGVPTEPDQITQRALLEDAIGPPYFYYENVALAPVGSVELTERIRKALEAYDDEPPSSVQKYVLDECRKWNLVWVGMNKVVPLEPDEVEMLLEVVFYCLGIPLKTDEQELNGDRLEQLMSRFGEFDLFVGGIQCNNLTGRNKPWKVQQSSEGHNGYNPNKENDRHGRGSNDITKLDLASRYNQSAGGGLVHSHNTPNETYGSVIGGSC
ncbi:DNA (Cytosine-5)-methyltransferase DRM1/2 isoform 2 [Hibiscus syriacus]|uniref:DNA (Cytosine-5)-methyltransferase DRM1/2 isoform 2 n=1 Tax=Hibiscus syriacus TaxID=106335 RepID=A0A6A3C8Z6_HIBSY|nr:DNA (Cytosine-5)-methyltransferase DRM1/2 isoform 2 [Hibiscus syriacus]